MSTAPDLVALRCPSCGGPLRSRIEGFRPFTEAERRHLTPTMIKTLDLCPTPGCPSRVPPQRSGDLPVS